MKMILKLNSVQQQANKQSKNKKKPTNPADMQKRAREHAKIH